jgi:lipoate-protein ligase B
MNELRTTNHELRTLCLCDCGLADYRNVLQHQLQLWEQRCQDKIPDTVLIVEHPPVITLGARKSANKLLVSREDLAKKGIDVVEIRRGGGTTAHNPGQLVFYPILHLQQLDLGISEYIRELEAIGAELLAQFGVNAQRQKGFPGLWVTNHESQTTNHEPRVTKKIASIGVRVSKGITCHGMAININNDLGIFDLFVPCGLDGVEMTSALKETGQHHPMSEVKKILATLLEAYFQTSEVK